MQIVDVTPALAPGFRALNETWIERHFALEASDRAALGDPFGYIVDKGGVVRLALDEAGVVIGTAALIPMADGGFELAKMTVADAARGQGVARALMQDAIAIARARGAPRVYLETNSVLAPALALYRSTGFRHLPSQPSPYARADVFMELRLDGAPLSA